MSHDPDADFIALQTALPRAARRDLAARPRAISALRRHRTPRTTMMPTPQ
jgi:hypothetical protein